MNVKVLQNLFTDCDTNEAGRKTQPAHFSYICKFVHLTFTIGRKGLPITGGLFQKLVEKKRPDFYNILILVFINQPYLTTSIYTQPCVRALYIDTCLQLSHIFPIFIFPVHRPISIHHFFSYFLVVWHKFPHTYQFSLTLPDKPHYLCTASSSEQPYSRPPTCRHTE